jgi:hypothetical protein
MKIRVNVGADPRVCPKKGQRQGSAPTKSVEWTGPGASPQMKAKICDIPLLADASGGTVYRVFVTIPACLPSIPLTFGPF